jgi:thiamine-phosphate pyrophosphorylase
MLSHQITLILNDRADLTIAADASGVHLGQDDLPPEAARRIIGDERILGVSTHNLEQLAVAQQTSANYLAVGPVFPTTSKEHPDPTIGLEGVRQARVDTRRPLVAIGGITLQNCQSVIEAGANSVAVIGELLSDPRKVTEQFLLKMAKLG